MGLSLCTISHNSSDKFILIIRLFLGFPGAKTVKNLPAMWKTWVRSQGWAAQIGAVVKNTTVDAGDIRDMGSILVSERSPGVQHDNPRQYPCLENPQEQRSLVGYSSQGLKESDMSEAT